MSPKRAGPVRAGPGGRVPAGRPAGRPCCSASSVRDSSPSTQSPPGRTGARPPSARLAPRSRRRELTAGPLRPRSQRAPTARARPRPLAAVPRPQQPLADSRPPLRGAAGAGTLGVSRPCGGTARGTSGAGGVPRRRARLAPVIAPRPVRAGRIAAGLASAHAL